MAGNRASLELSAMQDFRAGQAPRVPLLALAQLASFVVVVVVVFVVVFVVVAVVHDHPGSQRGAACGEADDERRGTIYCEAHKELLRWEGRQPEDLIATGGRPENFNVVSTVLPCRVDRRVPGTSVGTYLTTGPHPQVLHMVLH